MQKCLWSMVECHFVFVIVAFIYIFGSEIYLWLLQKRSTSCVLLSWWAACLQPAADWLLPFHHRLSPLLHRHHPQLHWLLPLLKYTRLAHDFLMFIGCFHLYSVLHQHGLVEESSCLSKQCLALPSVSDCQPWQHHLSSARNMEQYYLHKTHCRRGKLN